MVSSDFIFVPLSYSLVILMGFALINFLTNGFLLIWIKVKSSRGRKVLLRVITTSDIYYASGYFEDGLLRYVDRNKNKKSIVVKKDGINYERGLKTIEIDDENGIYINKNYEVVSAFDSVKIDDFIERAILSPKNPKDFLTVILLIASIVGAFASVYVAYQMMKLSPLIVQLAQSRVI